MPQTALFQTLGYIQGSAAIVLQGGVGTLVKARRDPPHRHRREEGPSDVEPTDPANQRQSLHILFQRPAGVVVTVCQMLIGLGLAIALLLKAYMFIFTDHVCLADGATLGNIIRCTPVLLMLSQFLMFVAALRFAGLLFAPHLGRIFETILLSLVAVLLRVLADLTLPGAHWELALVLLALSAAIAGAALATRFLPPSDRDG
ncbi:MAG: hypothetical protein HC844_06260 [Tabrizicola sp.]|nr:hypothetical protein [Tabrizicola sp.]